MSDELYDRYLEECLAGRAESPDAFCDRHPGAEPLRRQLEALYRLVSDSPAAAPEHEVAERGVPFERLGEFRLLRPLARGGMGSLYLAEQEALGRVVALKIVREDLRDSPTAAERFRREALAVARLSHPAIVGVHALGEEQGVRYIAMELVPGKALTEILAEHAGAGRTLPYRTAAKWLAEIARAAHHAHEHGVIHRDIKPSNIRVTPDGRPRLLDFGVARDERWKGKTVTGAFTGSPLYAAPEQLLGKPVDARADVYGLGATLYQCLTGRTPFDGETIERLVTRMLVEDPVPVRRLNPGVPRDLEVVARKALERDPARRYASAAELADDLEAVIESRPIRARPPGPLLIAAKWARRRPLPAATLAGVVVLAGVVAGLLVARHRADVAEAARLVRDARARIESYRRERAATEELEAEVAKLQGTMHANYSSREQDRLLERNEDAVAAARRAREAAFYEVLDLLRRAEALDPDTLAEADQVRAALYLEKWREARTTQQPDAAAFYRDLVAKHDREGLHARELRVLFRLSVSSDPSGAEVHIFRRVEQADLVANGDHRYVAVPVHGVPEGLVAGAFALRVVGGAGGLVPGDLILQVAGYPTHGVMLAEVGGTLDRVVRVGDTEVTGPYEIEQAPPDAAIVLERGGTVARAAVLTPWQAAERCGARARVYRNGAVEEMTLPKGLVLRHTAAPLYFCDRSLVGRTPTHEIELDSGHYILVVRHEGYEDWREAFVQDKGQERTPSARLLRTGSTPPGFARVRYSGREEGGSFLIMEREVTVGEYFEFLDDPETRGRIAASQKPILYPRTPDGAIWPPDETGRFIPSEPADLPVCGVSWFDACDYARWLTARARADGKPWTYAIPTYEEWQDANASPESRYPFGNRFRPKWIKSCFSRPRANFEPILRFPIDESAYGVFDLCGSAREWLDDWYDEPRQLRRMAGGSWAQGKPEIFEQWGHGHYPGSATGDFGFRLVLREDER